MPCFSPIKGYRSSVVNPKTGRFGITFKPDGAFTDLPVEVPCGQCFGCRMKRANEWAVRCVQEASMYKDNCFVTLTYSDGNLPENGSLRPRDMVLFMKRLRKKVGKVRFFQCGEYGEKLGRPHHHLIIFGWRPDDLKLWSVKGDKRLYRSSLLETLWRYGFVSVGDVTYESAAYCARYILKKVTGPDASKYYGDKKPEYITMSRRPGIAGDWIAKYWSDVYSHDKVVTGLGRVSVPPRFYDNKFNLMNPDKLESLKKERVKRAVNCPDVTPDRLKVREAVAKAKADALKRELHTP